MIDMLYSEKIDYDYYNKLNNQDKLIYLDKIIDQCTTIKDENGEHVGVSDPFTLMLARELKSDLLKEELEANGEFPILKSEDPMSIHRIRISLIKDVNIYDYIQ